MWRCQVYRQDFAMSCKIKNLAWRGERNDRFSRVTKFEETGKESVEQSGSTRPAPSPKFLAHSFKPGQVAPKGAGRPKGVASKIRELTNDGAEILQCWYEVMQGRHGAKARDRLDAGEKLAMRLWGKPLETSVSLALTGDDMALLPDVAPEQLATLTAILRPQSAIVEAVEQQATELATESSESPAKSSEPHENLDDGT